MKRTALVLLALLPVVAWATLVEQCEMVVGGKLLTTEIAVQGQGTAFPLRVGYAGREVVFPHKSGNMYRTAQGGLQVHASDAKGRHRLALTGGDGKECLQAKYQGATCYTVRRALVSFGATRGHAQMTASTTHGVLACSAG